MREVVTRINTPGIPDAVVMHPLDAIHHGVAHIHVGMRHVDFRAQDFFAIGKLAGPHPLKEVEALGGGSLAVGTRLAGGGDAATVFPHFIKAQIVHVGIAGFDKLAGPVKELFKVITRKTDLCPFKTKPANIVLNRLHKLLALLLGVGVVKTQVAKPLEFTGDLKIQANRLGVPDLQVAVRFRRETCLHPPIMFPGGYVGSHHLANEINRLFFGFRHLENRKAAKGTAPD